MEVKVIENDFLKHVRAYVLEDLLIGNKQMILDRIDDNLTSVKNHLDSAESQIRQQKVSFATRFQVIKTGVIDVNASMMSFETADVYVKHIESLDFIKSVLEDLRKEVENHKTESNAEALASAIKQIVKK